jgi:hypothetical protein
MEAFGIICIVASVVGVWIAVNWVLGPLDRAAKNRRYPIQFTLADFLCLFVQIQLLLAIPATLFRGMENKGPVIAVTVVIILFVLLEWWTGVRTLSRAGVHNTRGRVLTLVIAIPFGYALSLSIPVVMVMLWDSLSRPIPVSGGRGGLTADIFFLAESAIFFAVWGLGIMTRHILTTAEPRSQRAPLSNFVPAEPANDPTSPPHSQTRTSP